MASRAQVIHDYGLGRGSERLRRDVSYRSSEDPIDIPRGRSSSGGGLAMAISALIASSVILGGAYAIYAGPPPPMAVTAAAPLSPTWRLDAQPVQAAVTEALHGPARAVPHSDLASTAEEQTALSDDPGGTAATGGTPAPSSPPATAGSREVIIDDRHQLPQPATAPEPQPEIYPDPVKTPADAIGPELDLDKASPGLDPENPYRD